MFREETMLKCMILLLDDIEARKKEGYIDFREDREMYEEVKHIFEKHFGFKIRSHYE